MATNAVVEGYVNTTLDPEQRAAELRARGAGDRADEIAARGDEIPREQRSLIKRAREGLIEDGVPVETYRRIGLDEALARLV
jgi:type III secretion system FlhB-like substrate exporter